MVPCARISAAEAGAAAWAMRRRLPPAGPAGSARSAALAPPQAPLARPSGSPGPSRRDSSRQQDPGAEAVADRAPAGAVRAAAGAAGAALQQGGDRGRGGIAGAGGEGAGGGRAGGEEGGGLGLAGDQDDQPGGEAAAERLGLAHRVAADQPVPAAGGQPQPAVRAGRAPGADDAAGLVLHLVVGAAGDRQQRHAALQRVDAAGRRGGLGGGAHGQPGRQPGRQQRQPGEAPSRRPWP